MGNRLDHAEFLELIVQDELLVRQERLMERRTKQAMVREARSLEDFDFSFNPSAPRKRISDLATCRVTRQAAVVRGTPSPSPRWRVSSPQIPSVR